MAVTVYPNFFNLLSFSLLPRYEICVLALYEDHFMRVIYYWKRYLCGANCWLINCADFERHTYKRRICRNNLGKACRCKSRAASHFPRASEAAQTLCSLVPSWKLATLATRHRGGSRGSVQPEYTFPLLSCRTSRAGSINKLSLIAVAHCGSAPCITCESSKWLPACVAPGHYKHCNV